MSKSDMESSRGRGAILAAMALIVAIAGWAPRAGCQDTSASAETTPPGPATTAVANARRLYFLNDYAGAVAIADSALKHSLGSTELQGWRVASLARLPGFAARAIIPARRMAAMHASSAWSWFGLAGAALEIPDSLPVALAASAKAAALAPKDPAAQWMRAEVLRRGGKPEAAISFVDSLPAALRNHPLLVRVREAAGAQRGPSGGATPR